MCDPVSLALASTAATVVGAGGSLMNSMGAAKAAKKQQQEVLAWQKQQKQNRDNSYLRQDELRKQAEAARQEGLDSLDAESHKKRQGEEEEAIAKQLTGEGQVGLDVEGAPVSQSDEALAAQNTTSTSGDTYKSDLAAALNTATKNSRHRARSLATMSSFGNVVGRQDPDILKRAGSGIDMANEFRRGELGVLGAQQAVDPVQISYTPSPFADAFSTALQVGSQGLGNAFAPGGGFAKSAGTSTLLPEMAGKTQLPKFAPIPPVRPF